MNNTILFFTTPAHGHINPALPLINKLICSGYKVIAYSTPEFKSIIEDSGALFIEYDSGGISFDPSIGSEILPLTKLILRFSEHIMPILLDDIEKYKPCLIMHDTLALWGRIASETSGVHGVSINTLQTIYGLGSRTFRIYCRNFGANTLPQIRDLKQIIKIRKRLDRKYILLKKDIISLLMNREKLNLFTYPVCMHPDGSRLSNDCFFIGNTSSLRQTKGGFRTDKSVIYVSMGTIFNKNLRFYRRLIEEFKNTEYDLLVSCGSNYGILKQMDFPDNITLAPYVDQKDTLKHARLFITAGGMNSLCEAISAGVPCLIVPQQGEQRANAAMVRRLGAGKISKGKLYRESRDLINNFERNPDVIKAFSKIDLDLSLSVIKDYINTL